jgi:hypothetical protein
MRLAGFIATALALAQPAGADTIERRSPADPRGAVEIVNVSGEVQVSGWDKPEILVSAETGSSIEQLEIKSEGPRTLIKVVLPKGRSTSGPADLSVRIPRDSSLSVNTISASQTIDNVRGAQRLQAVSGSINTQAWAGDFEAKTVSGDLTVKGHGGAGLARATTVSGDMILHNMVNELEINTVSGDMEVTAEQLSRARIKTTNGDVDLITTLMRDARIEAEAINGELRFQLRGLIDAEFDIETFNGDIDNCFGPEPRRTREFAPGNELRFKQGEGNGRVRIKTLNGAVSLCKK